MNPMPEPDLVAHENEDCVCGPLVVPVVGGDGSRTQVVVHRRLDGRDGEVPVEAGAPRAA